MTEATQVPTIREELDRKTLETMNEMTFDYEEKGFMSQETYFHSLRAVHMVTNGLIDNEISDWMSDNLEKNTPSSVDRRVFSASGIIVVMQRPLMGDSFDMIRIANGKQVKTTKNFADEDQPHAACKVGFEKLLGGLIAKGFVEVGDE